MAQPLEHIDGKYEILEKLREGGMGAIYKVRHRLLEEIRVIKVMRPTLRDDEELYARFLREARMAIQLRHPNIAQLYDFTIDDDGNAFIVMEFIRGLNFGDLIDQAGPPPLGLTLEMAVQALKALDYLHRQGFVHRDISPDNLMLSQDFDERPLIKLIDLGIAKSLEGNSDLTATGHFLGKVRYCSPEQLESTSSITTRSDLYSFGLVLYELLTGKCPIAGETPSALIAGHLIHPPTGFEKTDPKGRVPAALRQAVLRALAKKPEERFASAEEFQEALEAVQADFPFTHELSVHTHTLLESDQFDVSDHIEPGSTQHRLDQEFGLKATPQPEARTDKLPPPDLPENGPSPQGGSSATAETEIKERPDPQPPTRRLDEPPPPPPALVRDATAAPPVSSQGVHDGYSASRPLEPSFHHQQTAALGNGPRSTGTSAATGTSWARRVALAIVVLAVLVGAALAAWQFLGRDESSSPPAPAAATGRLVLNAVPWAQVVAITDSQGDAVEVAPATYTPTSLALPAGSYILQLRRDGETRSVEAEIAAGETTRLQVRLEEISADELLQQLGW